MVQNDIDLDDKFFLEFCTDSHQRCDALSWREKDEQDLNCVGSTVDKLARRSHFARPEEEGIVREGEEEVGISKFPRPG